jgi:hypothetical protein
MATQQSGAINLFLNIVTETLANRQIVHKN